MQIFLITNYFLQGMHEKEFVGLCRRQRYDEKDISRFKAALGLIRSRLVKEKRLGGDTFFDHNIRVAAILAENKSAPEIVLTGILHDTLKYGFAQKIKDEFGEDILHLIEGIGEIKTIKSKNKEMQAEALRKILLTTLKDVRVILVKLANKLDNLRSIGVLPEKEQRRIAEEVLEVYAPLAYRLGAEKVRVQLEDLAFRTINLRKYQEISNFLEESREDREKEIEKIIELVNRISVGKVDILKIKGRPKHVYSIYKKIIQRKVKLDEQYDLLGMRVIVPEIKDCYTLLALLHEKFTPVEGRLKDYIANPKSNYYRSLHTGVKLPNGKQLEIQIRTPEMDEFAEEGLAAHWRYKRVKSDQFFEKKVAWLRNVLDMRRESKDSSDFIEAAKVDVFGDKIYCYTPKGDVKELPVGATILDFAFLVHEEVGNHTVAARVNGKFVPLRHKLALGDVIEVITNKNQRPRRSWLKIVRSGRARQKIRKSLKTHEKLAPTYFRLPKPLIKEEQGVLVESSEFPKAVCVLAKCCLAIPGEGIVGIVTKRRVVSVHRKDCRSALRTTERWVPVNWKKKFNQKIRFYVQAKERSGLLADLLHTIAAAGFEVKGAKAKLIDIQHAECSFLVIPKDLEELKKLVEKVKKVKGVTRIFFD